MAATQRTTIRESSLGGLSRGPLKAGVAKGPEAEGVGLLSEEARLSETKETEEMVAIRARGFARRSMLCLVVVAGDEKEEPPGNPRKSHFEWERMEKRRRIEAVSK